MNYDPSITLMTFFDLPPLSAIYSVLWLPSLIVIIHHVQVPHVSRTDYQLIDISEDGFVSYNPIPFFGLFAGFKPFFFFLFCCSPY